MFKFREVKEVRTEEKNLVRNQNEGEIDITKRIKPESMTVDEAQSFWNNLFDNAKEQ